MVADAAARKGIAFRASVDQIIHNLSPGISTKKKAGVSDVYIGKHAVIKHCDQLAAEEEALAEGLGQIFDPELYTSQAPLMDLVKLGITLQDCSIPSIMDDLPETPGWAPAKPGHVAVIKPTINNLLLLTKVEDDETENILTSRLASFTSELKSIRVLYVQPLNLNAGNIGFRPILAPRHVLYEDALFSYDEKSQQPLSKVMRDYLKGLADDTVMEILFANGNKTSAKICDHPGLIEALNSPWELEFFDMDKSLYETNDLISKDSEAIPPLLYDLAELEFAHRPLSKIAIERLMADGAKIPEALRYLKKDYHPLLMRMGSEAKSKFRRLLDDYLSNYRLGIQLTKPAENLSALRDQFANDLASDPYNEIWHCLDPVYQAAHPNSLPLSHPQMQPKRLEVAAQLFPRATIAQQNAFKERMKRQSIYLKQYNELICIDPKLPFWQKTQAIQDVLECPIMPHSATRQQAVERLAQIGNMLDFALREIYLLAFWQRVTIILRPSLRNLVLVHYPITTEIFQLARVAHRTFLVLHDPVNELITDAQYNRYTAENCSSLAILLDKIKNMHPHSSA